VLLYRIIFAQYADAKFAPGVAGRWNREGERVLYTSPSPALAMAELMANRLGQGFLTAGYSLITFEVPDSVAYKGITRDQLPDDWRMFSSYSISQQLGSAWYHQRELLMLKVPSAVVPGDWNIVVNATHPSYDLLQVKSRQAFPFDERFIKADQKPKKNSGQ